ncbi:MAG: hypothetical protein WBW81_05535 [Methylocella sp.]
MKILAVLQTILGTILLFLFGLGVRNKMSRENAGRIARVIGFA